MTDKSTAAKPPREGTVSRVLRLLMIFGEHEGMIGVHEIAKRSGLPISTVHRLVNLIADDGFVQYDPASRLYSLGPQMHRLTALLWSSGPAVVAQPFLDELSREFDETVVFNLYLPGQHAISPIAKSEGTRALRYVLDMNEPLELAWGASGKCVLAYLDEDVVRDVYTAAKPSEAGFPLADWDDYLEELRVIRERGYALSVDQRIPGAQGVGAVVIGARDEVVGGICITFPRERPLTTFTVEEMGGAIVAASRELGRRLGAKD